MDNVNHAAEALRTCKETVHAAKAVVDQAQEDVTQTIGRVEDVMRGHGYGDGGGGGGGEGPDILDPQDVRNMQEGLLYFCGTRAQRKRDRAARGIRRNVARDACSPQKEEELSKALESLACA